MVLVLFCAVGSPKVRPSDACHASIARSVTDGIGGVGEISGPVPVGRDTVGDHERILQPRQRNATARRNLRAQQAAMSRAVARCSKVTEGEVADP